MKKRQYSCSRHFSPWGINPTAFVRHCFEKLLQLEVEEGMDTGQLEGKWQLKRAHVDKCKRFGVEHGCSHRHQCLKARARRINTINCEHLYCKSWRSGLGCPFLPLCVTLPLLISLLLREQTADTPWSVDRCVAGWQSKGLSNLTCVWVTKIRLQPVSAWPESLFKGLFRFCSLELLLHFQPVAANIWGVLCCASWCPISGSKSR